MAGLFTFLLCCCVYMVASKTPLPEWHMKPIGSHIPPNKVDEVFADAMISPEDFGKNYVLPRKPIVFRDVVKKWPAFKLWTDDYLKENFGDMELRIEAKKEKLGKIPKGDVCLGRDRLKTFLNEYQQGADKYVVSELPTPMWSHVHVPPPMGCGDFANNFVEIDFWINSDMGKKGKGGRSLLHKDAFNTVNCVVNGTKDWKLFQLKYNDYIYQSWEGPSEAGFGGFSLINPEKVDAKKFPNIGKIPEWQLTTINAGDCLYLPSQMWHQVKSKGESNKAVAFLFNRFEDVKINTSNCPEKLADVPLSDIDVDLQYPGHGLMTMGDNEIVQTQSDLQNLIDPQKGVVTKKRVFMMVYRGNAHTAKQKDISLNKAKEFYKYLLELAGGDAKKMNAQFVTDLTRNQIRNMYKWIFREEPSNSYNYEYSMHDPSSLSELLTSLKTSNGGKVDRNQFIGAYEEMGGTNKFAVQFWEKLTGGDKDAPSVEDYSKTLDVALEKYVYYQMEDGDDESTDEDRITTPQGHMTQAKKEKSDFRRDGSDDEEEEEEGSEDGTGTEGADSDEGEEGEETQGDETEGEEEDQESNEQAANNKGDKAGKDKDNDEEFDLGDFAVKKDDLNKKAVKEQVKEQTKVSGNNEDDDEEDDDEGLGNLFSDLEAAGAVKDEL